MDTSLQHKFDSIIFDLDGTLWNSTASVSVAWQATADNVDYIKTKFTPEVVASICGLTYDAIFETLLPYLNDAQRIDFQTRCSKTELEVLAKTGGILYPGLEETLAALSKKYKLFIVSNCQSGYIEIFFDTSGLGHYFQGHQCFGTKDQPKAENIMDIVNDHQLKAPVYLGDTQSDHNSAIKAGVPFIFAAYGFGQVEGQIEASVNSLAELQQLL